MTSRRSLGISLLVLASSTVLCVGAVSIGMYWGTGPSLRCEAPKHGPVQPGWSARSLVSGGRERCFYVYAPSQYDPTQPTAVVVSIHGILSNPNSHAAITGWHALADREGFLVVYPQGTSFPQRWEAGPTWEVGVDDVQFFRDILEALTEVATVDRSAVYVNGLSNGGGMSGRIACHAADQVAAIGTVAAAVDDLRDCRPSRPVPLMAYHGTEDALVSYEGGGLQSRVLLGAAGLAGAPTRFFGAEEWVALWAERNGCNPVPQPIPQQGDVWGRRYVGCDQDAEVILYTIEGGGHTWPGGMPIPVGKTSRSISATEEMWRFFQAFRLTRGP